MNHRVRSTAHHHIRIAAKNERVRLTNRLRARRACCETIERRATNAKLAREMRKRHVGLLLDFVHLREHFMRGLRPTHSIKSGRAITPARKICGCILREIEHAFTRAKVQTDALAIQCAKRIKPRLLPRLTCRTERELRIQSCCRVHFHIGDKLRNVVILDFRRKGRGKCARIKACDRTHAALGTHESLPGGINVVTERRNPAHACDDHAIGSSS